MTYDLPLHSMHGHRMAGEHDDEPSPYETEFHRDCPHVRQPNAVADIVIVEGYDGPQP